jgi:predicted RNase H-like HicB family nuclease
LKINPIEVIIIPERSLKNIKYVVYREDKYYVGQCLNVDVSSFGTTLDLAVANLKEALELFFEANKKAVDFRSTDRAKERCIIYCNDGGGCNGEDGGPGGEPCFRTRIDNCIRTPW